VHVLWGIILTWFDGEKKSGADAIILRHKKTVLKIGFLSKLWNGMSEDARLYSAFTSQGIFSKIWVVTCSGDQKRRDQATGRGAQGMIERQTGERKRTRFGSKK
jgi:hypothetical protein